MLSYFIDELTNGDILGNQEPDEPRNRRQNWSDFISTPLDLNVAYTSRRLKKCMLLSKEIVLLLINIRHITLGSLFNDGLSNVIKNCNGVAFNEIGAEGMYGQIS